MNRARHAGTRQVVQSSRVAVTVGQPVWTEADDVGRRVLVMVMPVLSVLLGSKDWARIAGALINIR